MRNWEQLTRAIRLATDGSHRSLLYLLLQLRGDLFREDVANSAVCDDEWRDFDAKEKKQLDKLYREYEKDRERIFERIANAAKDVY